MNLNSLFTRALCYKAVFLVALVLLASCNKDDATPYPPIVTEFADLKADAQGRLATLITDDDHTLRISNPVEGFQKNAGYRAVCGFVREGDDEATLYSLQAVAFLRDSTATPRHDPVAAVSVWGTRRYINMHLRPMTRGGQQYWGFCIDSIKGRTAYVQLYHNQNDDPLAYSQDVYASLPVDSIPGHASLDTIRLTIPTFKQNKTWTILR